MLKMKLLSHGTISLVPNPKCIEKCGLSGSGFYPPGNFVNHLKTVSTFLDNCFVLLCLQTSDVDSVTKAFSQSPSWVARVWQRGPQETFSSSESLGTMLASSKFFFFFPQHQRGVRILGINPADTVVEHAWLGEERCILGPGYYSTGFSPCKRNSVWQAVKEYQSLVANNKNSIT